MSSNTFRIKANDRRPYLQIAFVDANGDAVNLTGALAVRFHMKPVDSATLKIDGGSATVTDATNGLAEYRWTVGDTDTAGLFHGEFEIEWTSGVYETHPVDTYLAIKITSDLS